MPLKHRTLVGGAVACLALLSATVVSAAPWFGPGDPRMRHAVQKLADRGHLDTAVTTWPLMVGSLDAGLDRNRASQDGVAVAQSLAYVRFEQEAQASPGFRATFTVSGTTETPYLRGFEGGPRESGEASVLLEWQGNAWALGLSPTYAANPQDNEDWRFDGTYLAATASNWVFGVGAIDRWWGPGWQSSLILSNNARPVPAVWINRRAATAPEQPWLQWLGPWQLTTFLGQLEDERHIEDAKLFGMRLTLRPIDGLDIGFSRTFQIGGEGRPENSRTFWDALIGRDNGQQGGPEDDPSNQLGSIDVRYGFGVGQQTIGLYAQMMGEDEAGGFPARKSWLFGLDATSQLGNSDQQWFLEHANTLADDMFGSAMPNISYEHSVYRSGYRYYGRNLATSLEGDARATTLGFFNFFPDGRNLGLSLTYAELNAENASVRASIPDDRVSYRIPVSAQTRTLATLSYGLPAYGGWLDIYAQVADKKIDLASSRQDPTSVGATWRYRF